MRLRLPPWSLWAWTALAAVSAKEHHEEVDDTTAPDLAHLPRSVLRESPRVLSEPQENPKDQAHLPRQRRAAKSTKSMATPSSGGGTAKRSVHHFAPQQLVMKSAKSVKSAPDTAIMGPDGKGSKSTKGSTTSSFVMEAPRLPPRQHQFQFGNQESQHVFALTPVQSKNAKNAKSAKGGGGKKKSHFVFTRTPSSAPVEDGTARPTSMTDITDMPTPFDDSITSLPTPFNGGVITNVPTPTPGNALCTTDWMQIGDDVGGFPDRFFGESVSVSDTGSFMVVGSEITTRLFFLDTIPNPPQYVLSGEILGLGASVSSDETGTVVAIGDPTDNGNTGEVRVFDTTMAQIGNDIPGNTLDEEFGYNVALNGNGDTVVASAPFAPCLSGMGRCGRVAVYRFDAVASMEWVQIGADIFGFQEDGEFGASVDISFDGNRIVVGAPAPDNDAVLGIVTVFTYDGFNWNQVANTISGLNNLDAFGRSVSMSDDGLTFAIGAPDFNSNEGLVEVYQFDSSINSWQILGGSISNLSQDRDAGWSVSLSGDGRTVTVGIASVDEPSLTGRSQIYTFDSGLQNWVQVGSDIPGLFNGDQSGYAVSNSFDGRLVAISSVDFNSDQGQVRVFQCQ